MSSANPFALLNDSDDDEEAAPQQTAPKAAVKPEVKKPTETKAAPKKPPAKTETGKEAETPTYDRGGRGGGAAADNRGGRGGKSRPPRDGKREFDRHSGTGRPPTEMKRGGAGRHNWGAEGDQGDSAEFTGEAGEESEEMKARREEREKEEKQITFEEYEKKMASSKGAFAAKATVEIAALQGEALVRPDDDAGYQGSKGKFRTKAKKETNSFDKSLLGFQAPAHEVDTGKGGKGKGYGGRGGGKSKGGNSGGRGKSGPEMTVDVQDTSAFPTL